MAPAIPLLVMAAWGELAVATSSPGDGWNHATVEVVAVGLDGPANFALAPDGSVWWAGVYSGNVSRFDPATGVTELRYQVPIVKAFDERGLVGFALDHDFADNGVFYLYYTKPGPGGSQEVNRLVRVEDGREHLLTMVPAAPEHNGGRIEVLDDGTMFVSTGENQLRDPAQDPDSLLGKILRMTTDGDPVEGNLKGLVYSRGHRNVYGLAYEPETGALWATENSGWRRDEVNVIEAGGNYGYPECEGHGLNGVDTPCPTDKGYIFPIRSYYEDRTVAPTGATFWHGGFYFGSLREGSIHHVWQAANGSWMDAIVYDGEAAILDLRVSPNGDQLYFSTFDGIYRLNVPEPIAAGDSDPWTDPPGGPGQDSGERPGANIPFPTVAMLFLTGGVAVVAARRTRQA